MVIPGDKPRDRATETYAEYVQRYYRPSAKDGMPGYEGAGPHPVMSESQYYYVQSGQHHRDLMRLESEYGRNGFDRSNFDKLRDKWWETAKVNYGYPTDTHLDEQLRKILDAGIADAKAELEVQNEADKQRPVRFQRTKLDIR